MKLIKFIEQETKEPYRQVLLIAVISGMANSLLVGIVNHAAEAVSNHEDLTQYFLLYIITFSLFVYGQWYVFKNATHIVENAIFQVRLRIRNKLQCLSVDYTKATESHALYQRFSRSDGLISQFAPMITSSFQLFVLTLFSLLYLVHISPISFILVITILLGYIFYFIREYPSIFSLLLQLREKEFIHANIFSDSLGLNNSDNSLPSIEKNKSELVGELLIKIQKLNIKIKDKELRLLVFGRFFIYATLAILLFIIPSFDYEYSNNILKVSATLLFLAGPITMIINIIPIISRVEVAIGELLLVESEIDTLSKESKHLIASDSK